MYFNNKKVASLYILSLIVVLIYTSFLIILFRNPESQNIESGNWFKLISAIDTSNAAFIAFLGAIITASLHNYSVAKQVESLEKTKMDEIEVMRTAEQVKNDLDVRNTLVEQFRHSKVLLDDAITSSGLISGRELLFSLFKEWEILSPDSKTLKSIKNTYQLSIIREIFKQPSHIPRDFHQVSQLNYILKFISEESSFFKDGSVLINFSGLDFSRLTIKSTLFNGCIFDSAIFENARLEDCDFWGCSIVDVNFKGMTAVRLTFERSKVFNSDFNDSEIYDSSFRNAQFAVNYTKFKCLAHVDLMVAKPSVEEMLLQQKSFEHQYYMKGRAEIDTLSGLYDGFLLGRDMLVGVDVKNVLIPKSEMDSLSNISLKGEFTDDENKFQSRRLGMLHDM